MKKKILLLLIIIVAGCKSTEKPTMALEDKDYIPPLDFAGQLDGEKLAFIKDNYNWPEESVLVINYKQPNSRCHFNYKKKVKDSTDWWRASFSKTALKNSSEIYVISESHYVTRFLDNETYFGDKGDFLFENFFERKHSCYGVMVVNETGDYLQYNGNYNKKQVAKYVEALDRSVPEE